MNVTDVTFIKRVATRKRDEVRWREPNPADKKVQVSLQGSPPTADPP